MDSANETFSIGSEWTATELQPGGIASENTRALSSPEVWHDSRVLKVLGTGTALPGPPVSTAEKCDVVA
jgi:hypothetical protein